MKIIIRILVFLLYIDIQLLIRYSLNISNLGGIPSVILFSLMCLLSMVLCKLYDSAKKPKEKPEDFLATHTFKYEGLTSINKKGISLNQKICNLINLAFAENAEIN